MMKLPVPGHYDSINTLGQSFALTMLTTLALATDKDTQLRSCSPVSCAGNEPIHPGPFKERDVRPGAADDSRLARSAAAPLPSP